MKISFYLKYSEGAILTPATKHNRQIYLLEVDNFYYVWAWYVV